MRARSNVGPDRTPILSGKIAGALCPRRLLTIVRPIFVRGRVEVRDFTVLGARYWMVLGQGLAYPAYHSRVLQRIHERF